MESHRLTPVVSTYIVSWTVGRLGLGISYWAAVSHCMAMTSPHQWPVLWSWEPRCDGLEWSGLGDWVGIWDWGVGLTYGDGVSHLSRTYLTTSSHTESKAVCGYMRVCVCVVCVLMHHEKCPHLQSTLLMKGQTKVTLGQFPLHMCVFFFCSYFDRAGSETNTLTCSSYQPLWKHLILGDLREASVKTEWW